MRVRLVIRLLGVLSLLLSLTMAPFLLFAVYARFRSLPGETEAVTAFAAAMLLGGLIGAAMIAVGRADIGQVRTRESLLLVALAWTVGAALAGLPFWLWGSRHPFPVGGDAAFQSYLNCYFEAMAGLTTTGASTLTDIQSVPRSLLLWRGFIQWLGGLGIVVLFVAILPLIGAGGSRLFLWEKTGIVQEGGRHQIRVIARALWLIYAGITLAEVLLLVAAGMGWTDALEHSFATMATGGFSTRNASIGQFASPAIDWIIIVFMVLAGANFGFYYRALTGQWRSLARDPELRGYLIISAVGVVVTIALIGSLAIPTTDGRVDTGLGALIRHGTFQALSFQTSTGFATADSDQWGPAVKMLLIGLMFIGGCTGSTSGGLKIIRVLVVGKTLLAHMTRLTRPRMVRPVRLGPLVIDEATQREVTIFTLIFGVVFVAGSAAIYLFDAHQGIDVVTAMSAAAATLNNVGPGFHQVGATTNFAWLSPGSKVVISMLMAIGRLELYAFLALFVPGFWRRV